MQEQPKLVGLPAMTGGAVGFGVGLVVFNPLPGRACLHAQEGCFPSGPGHNKSSRKHEYIKGVSFAEFTTPSSLPPEPVIAIIDLQGMKAVVSIETGELMDISIEDKPTMDMPVFRADLNSGGGFSMNCLISNVTKVEEGDIDLLVREFNKMLKKVQNLQK